MHHLRFSIAGTLSVVLFAAVGLAALREDNQLWDSCLFSVTISLLLFAVLLAVHRAGDRRAFWTGFALFGWGYLILSLIPSTEPRLISTHALEYLQESSVVYVRAPRLRAILDLDRMRANNLTSNDIMNALGTSHMVTEHVAYENFLKVVEEKKVSQLGQASKTVEFSWGNRFGKPEQFGNLILKATPEGEILRLKDVAKVERGSSVCIPRLWVDPTANFIRVGHSLFALLAAWLGGVLSRRLKTTEV